MKIAVINSFMNDAHREKISAAAAQHSMEVAYYKTNDEALPHLADVDRMVGRGAAQLRIG